MALNRTVSPSKSQSLTYEALGNAEDFSPIINNIDPTKTPFLSTFDELPDAKQTEFNWLTETLNPPKENAQLEMRDYSTQNVGSLETLKNYTQILESTGKVSDLQEKVAKVYQGTPMNRARKNAMIEHAKDTEFMLATSSKCNSGTDAAAAHSGGVKYFMKVASYAATLNPATGIVTMNGGTEHNLKDGDFVYFTADTMPSGLQEKLVYYIHRDTTNPTTAFTIFNTIEDAVMNTTAKQVASSTAGTGLKVVKNNVISLHGAANYTVDDINDVMQMCSIRGGNPTRAFMSHRKKRRFSDIIRGLATTNRKSGDHDMDITANVFQTDFGIITAESHPLYGDDRIDILDMNYWGIKYLERPHQVKGLAKKGSYEEFVITSTLGLQATQPKASGSLVDIAR